METLQNAMNGLFSAEEHFKHDLKTVSSAVTDVHRRCEKAREFRREKTKLLKNCEESLRQIEKLQGRLKTADKRIKKLKVDKEGQFMSTKQYRDKLVEQGVDLTGLDVCHIIACSHGGPDHTDNYLFALGAEFNRGIGDRCDALNCYLAG